MRGSGRRTTHQVLQNQTTLNYYSSMNREGGGDVRNTVIQTPTEIGAKLLPASGLAVPMVSREKALEQLRRIGATMDVEPQLTNSYFDVALRPNSTTSSVSPAKSRISRMHRREVNRYVHQRNSSPLKSQKRSAYEESTEEHGVIVSVWMTWCEVCATSKSNDQKVCKIVSRWEKLHYAKDFGR